MAAIFKNFGNNVALVILATDNTFPSSLTVATSTTGNCILINAQAQGKTKSAIGVTEKTFKTNDDNVFDTSEERAYTYEANLFNRDAVYTAWVNDRLTAAYQSGQKVLMIANLGYVAGTYKEAFAIGKQQTSLTEDDNVEDAMMFKFTSTPLTSSFSLTTTNAAAIVSALGSGTVKATIAVTIGGGVNANPVKYIYT